MKTKPKMKGKQLKSADPDDEPRPEDSVCVRFDDDWEWVTIADVRAGVRNVSDPLYNRCLRHEAMAFELDGLLEGPYMALEDVMRFMADVAVKMPVTAVVGTVEYTSVVEAVLTLTPPSPPDDVVTRLKEAALRYAARRDLENLEVPIKHVTDWFRRLGVTPHRPATLCARPGGWWRCRR